MKVLIIGSGGREHALAWKVQRSPNVNKVFVAPGNAGTAQEHNTENVPIDAHDIDALCQFAKTENIDLTIVGPEAPLCAGIVDCFQRAGLTCFGPKRLASRLEGSKAFSKDFMQRHTIPTARYDVFKDKAAAINALSQQRFPLVIKADGLAAGKGVIIAQNKEEALQAIEHLLTNQAIVMEEFLTGEELSFIIVTDGKTALPLASSQDHKARDNGDTGPNTGGMGAYSPAPILSTTLEANIMDTVVKPTLLGLQKEGMDYCGFLYFGLMITETGDPYLLEYNCRLGDPEAQVILPRMQTDLITVCLAALDKTLHTVTLEWNPNFALGVVLAAKGYPLDYSKNIPIKGLNNTLQDNQLLFHSGTHIQNNEISSCGGRVLCGVALGPNVIAAQSDAYQLLQQLNHEDFYYRTDIGYKALEK